MTVFRGDFFALCSVNSEIGRFRGEELAVSSVMGSTSSVKSTTSAARVELLSDRFFDGPFPSSVKSTRFLRSLQSFVRSTIDMDAAVVLVLPALLLTASFEALEAPGCLAAYEYVSFLFALPSLTDWGFDAVRDAEEDAE